MLEKLQSENSTLSEENRMLKNQLIDIKTKKKK